MRRIAAALALAAALLPGALTLGFGVSDFEAARCAMACGHETPAAGMACCPVSDGAPSFKTCPRDQSALAPTPALPPAILARPLGLESPRDPGPLVCTRRQTPASGIVSPPDHVPLILS